MDLPAEFYIETIRDVFQEHLLPQGKMTYRGRPVNPASIKRMGLMTVEGEKDDICSIGQTLAAQDLCTGVRAYRKVHHMQAGVGHYGVFSGRRWNNEIYPLLRDFVHVNSSVEAPAFHGPLRARLRRVCRIRVSPLIRARQIKSRPGRNYHENIQQISATSRSASPPPCCWPARPAPPRSR